jgi:DNA polymerase III subunit gamma/tau
MYQVIARKYRPQSFGDLIGQEHVQRTLVNAIQSQRLAQGYIFSGQRGTGKTTVARILARCLNCINGPTAEPCGVCSSCTEISAGNSVDVIEIDAASNRGINEMREIRENVRYRPARDRYKIFIIDEAHQITREAFNALLKTLEEPPEWVVFILCTTEAYEIPNTIASRCQHFAFRAIDFANVMNRLKYITAQEEIEADEDVLSVIAQAGEGSVRDSLSALDQAIACCGKTLQVESVRALLGMFGMEPLRAVAEAVQQQNGARMLEVVEELERTGQSLQHFCRELSRYWRNLLVAKITGFAASEQQQQRLLETAESFSEEDLIRYLNLTLELYKDMQSSLQPRLHLELGLLKLAQVGKLQSIEEVLAALEKPEPTAKALAPAGDSRPTQTAPKTGDIRQDLLDAFRKAGLSTSADALQVSEVRLQGNDLLIQTPKHFAFTLGEAVVQRVASEVIRKPIRVRVEIIDNATTTPAPAPSASEMPGPEESDVRQRALSHPEVKRFQELFPGAQVRTVRNLNE